MSGLPLSSTRNGSPNLTRRYVGLSLLLLGLAVMLGGVWIAVTGLLARSQLQSARNDLTALKSQVGSGDFAAARTTAADLRKHASKAEHLTSGPAWAVAAAVPGSSPLSTFRTLADQVDVLATDVLSPLSRVSYGLDPRRLVGPGGAVNLSPIEDAQPTLADALVRIRHARSVVADGSSHTWFEPVDDARVTLLGQFDALTRQLGAANTAARILPTVLGDHGAKRYFVGFQNDAEMRGTGGLPGAFGILLADDGKLRFERFENDGYLGGVRVDVPLGADYERTFAGNDTEGDYRNTNLSPHFPYAARLWMAMWQKKSGQRLDGAITLDPTALADLLRVTGPAKLADGTGVSSVNVVLLTQSLVYAVYGNDVNARKAFLLNVARAVSDRIVSTGASAPLVQAAAQAVDERRLLFYSADVTVEKAISDTSLSGEIPADARPYSGLSVVNLGGNKLDYYLDRSVDYRATGCGSERTATVTIKVTNAAPAGLPSYVTNRVESRLPAGYKPGDNRLLLSYYATSGATLTAATLDGRAALFYPQSLRAHPIWAFDVELPRGATRTLTLRLREPATSNAVQVLRQPGVRPLTVKVSEPHC